MTNKKICEICNKEFEPTSSIHQKFCSRSCFYESMRHEKYCEYCQVRIRHINSPSQKYCSWDCKNKAAKTIEDKNCSICGSIFHPDKETVQYCSRECYKIAGKERQIAREGYIWAYEIGHPNANSKGKLFEHRLVMSQILGRPLEPYETVHHINGDRTDNRPENLQLRSSKHGKGVIHTCLDCGSHNISTEKI